MYVCVHAHQAVQLDMLLNKSLLLREKPLPLQEKTHIDELQSMRNGM